MPLFYAVEIAESLLAQNANEELAGLAFTDETAATVERVVASIRRDLPAENQDIVDGYEMQLASAIAGLVVKEKADVNFVDVKALTATASSYQDNGSAPDKALDDDITTMWHSKWSITTMPHWFQISFTGDPEPVNGITYIPRQTGANGNVTSYIILGSNDGTNFETIKEGTLTSSTDAKEITFDTVTYKHIRIQYVTAVNNNGSAAEYKLHKANVVADKEGLKALIDDAKAVADAGYTEESWNALQTTIADAEALYNAEDADAQTVEVMKRTLTAAKVALVLKEAEKPVEPVKNPFEDVAETDWYYNAVLWGAQNKVVAGISETQFGPAANCTRAQIVAFLWRAAGRPEAKTTECPFTDVSASEYYYEAMLWAVENNIARGYTDKLFAPNATCTRAEMATFLWRVDGRKPVEGESPFTDVEADDYFCTPAIWASQNKVVSGYDDGSIFAPDNTIARAETVTMLYRYYK